jgi:tripartite ATP-independent transporter DctM subunit
VLAGVLMDTGGIARRLVDFAVALVGWIRGGLGMAVVVAEYIFSGISGSTVADVSAVASTTIPSMVRAGYSREQAVSVVSAASAMGILVPPCILMIVMGSLGSLSVAALFMAGLVPAVVLAVAIMGYIYVTADRHGVPATPAPGLRELGVAFRRALIPLGMPVIIVGGIRVGVVTPTEAAVVAVLYAAIVGLFVYREITWRQLPEILVQSCAITGAIGLLLGAAGVVAWFLTVQQLPALLIELMRGLPGGSIAFLVATALLFIFFGAVVEGLPAVVILLPSLLPVVKQLGIDPIHYSIVIITAVGIGLFLPPLGVGLFIACGVGNVTVDRVSGAMMPYIAVLCAGLALLIAVPWFSLVLPRLLNMI